MYDERQARAAAETRARGYQPLFCMPAAMPLIVTSSASSKASSSAALPGGASFAIVRLRWSNSACKRLSTSTYGFRSRNARWSMMLSSAGSFLPDTRKTASVVVLSRSRKSEPSASRLASSLEPPLRHSAWPSDAAWLGPAVGLRRRTMPLPLRR